MYMKAKRHRQGSTSMKRFIGLSLVPASQFVARVSQVFAFPLLAFRSYSYHLTVHHHTRTQALAWHGLIWRTSMGTCKISVSREWDGHGRCTCFRRPHQCGARSGSPQNCVARWCGVQSKRGLHAMPTPNPHTHTYIQTHLQLFMGLCSESVT